MLLFRPSLRSSLWWLFTRSLQKAVVIVRLCREELLHTTIIIGGTFSNSGVIIILPSTRGLVSVLAQGPPSATAISRLGTYERFPCTGQDSGQKGMEYSYTIFFFKIFKINHA